MRKTVSIPVSISLTFLALMAALGFLSSSRFAAGQGTTTVVGLGGVPGGGSGGTSGGVNSQTANYSAVTGDIGKLVVMNGANLTVTLPNPPPSAVWNVSIANLNSTPVTVSPNGLNIDGNVNSAVIYGQYTAIQFFTDGSNYFTGAPALASPVLLRGTNGGPLASVSQSIVIGTGNLSIIDSGSFTDFLVNGNLGTIALGRTAASHTLLGTFSSAGAQTVSGCSLTSSAGGTMAGKFNSGTAGTCTVTITMPAAPTGFTCDAHDTTTVADVINQTAFTTTTATISGTTASGDVITWKCEGF